MSALLVTPLHALHREYGARFAPFAGYEMPIQYPGGILAEHAHTRAKAGLFDVSHMGQAYFEGPSYEAAAAALERLCPADLKGLPPGRQRYSQLLNAQGGVVDDFMATRPTGESNGLFLVLNAARKHVDAPLIAAAAPAGVALRAIEDRALLALQGPAATAALSRATGADALAAMPFMSAQKFVWNGMDAFVSRSGYTGEDGFEISVPAAAAETFARRLLTEPDVAWVGLGARDTLRLEAGLCLYGHELTEEIDPVEANLTWSIAKRRRVEGGFPGAARIQTALAQGPQRRRVGLRLDGRAPAREGAEIVGPDERPVGVVTSGGFGPSVGAAIAMGYVETAFAARGTELALSVRGKALAARVVTLPFHPHAYFRG
jgi:aminomethyltransferase